MFQQRYDSIVITFPVQFLLDIAAPMLLKKAKEFKMDMPEQVKLPPRKIFVLTGLRECISQIDEMIANPDEMIWYHSIGNKPTQEILYVYISILNQIRYRAKVVEWQEGHDKDFSDGRKLSAKHWLVLCDFMKAPKPIPFKGCQGFRYTEKLF